MQIFTFDDEIIQIISVPKGTLVTTSTEHGLSIRTNRHFLVRNGQISELQNLRGGRFQYWDFNDQKKKLGWRQDSHTFYVTEDLAATHDSANAIEFFRIENYLTFSIVQEVLQEREKILWHSLTHTEMGDMITIFVKKSTRENKVFTWDKRYRNFVPSVDELTFVGFHDKELIVIDNPL